MNLAQARAVTQIRSTLRKLLGKPLEDIADQSEWTASGSGDRPSPASAGVPEMAAVQANAIATMIVRTDSLRTGNLPS
jgi:hypothetical protein